MEELGKIGASIFLHTIQAQQRNGTRVEPVLRKVKPVLVVRGSVATV
jgi:hypothetical protein